ncbi:MAG: hypothetical protein K5986_08785 [Clostridium sp.]|nr:hypothetical protein [Clostridium sp.]
MNTIKQKLLISFGAIMSIVVISMSIITFIMSQNAINDTAMGIIPEVVYQASEVVSNKIQIDIQSMEIIADELEDMDDINKQLELLSKLIEDNGEYICMGVADLNGVTHDTMGDTENFSDRVEFQSALTGKSALSEPIYIKEYDTMTSFFAIPIKDSKTGEVKKVLTAFKSVDDITDTVTDKIVGNGKYNYI